MTAASKGKASKSKSKNKSETPAKAKETTAATETSAETSSEASAASSAKSSSAPSRPVSYFSSVSTDHYRSGWDNVFGGKGNGKGKAKAKAKSSAGKAAKKLPVSLSLDAEELQADLRAHLEDLFRKELKRRKLNFDALSGKGQVSIAVTCHIAED